MVKSPFLVARGDISFQVLPFSLIFGKVSLNINTNYKYKNLIKNQKAIEDGSEEAMVADLVNF